MVKKVNNLIFSKQFCFGLLLTAFVYGLVLPFCWGNNPLDPMGTLSILCEDHKLFFWLWAVLTASSYIMNIRYMQKKYNAENRVTEVFVALAFIGILCVAATIKHDVTTVNPTRVIHWAGAIAFALFMGLALFIFLLCKSIKDKRFIVVGAICAAILIVMLGWLVFIGKSGLLEVIPNALLQLLIAVVNFTNIIRPKAE